MQPIQDSWQSQSNELCKSILSKRIWFVTAFTHVKLTHDKKGRETNQHSLTYPVVSGWISPGRLAALYRLLADLLHLLEWINRKQQEKLLKSILLFQLKNASGLNGQIKSNQPKYGISFPWELSHFKSLKTGLPDQRLQSGVTDD